MAAHLEDVSQEMRTEPERLPSVSIPPEEIAALLTHFGTRSYRPDGSNPVDDQTLQSCIELLKRDYNIFLINNPGGSLCNSYPKEVPFIETEKVVSIKNAPIYERPMEYNTLKALTEKSCSARCRCRFPVPVIMFRGKSICRSATLAGSLEIYGRIGLEAGIKSVTGMFKTYEYFLYGADSANYDEEDKNVTPSNSILQDITMFNDGQRISDLRRCDIDLLGELRVDTIVDLMVENRKAKYGLYVSSSEKIEDNNLYKSFKLISIPYPGCEFFTQFKSHSYEAEKLFYKWEEAFNDASLNITHNANTLQLDIDWYDYQKWNLIDITANYMKYLLKYFAGSNGGMLVHCISGWDRTPLFISLLRLSLWADGLIHQSLDEHEIIYFTIGYDWFCFGHQLPSRLKRNEDILLFCFTMLKYMIGPDFSIAITPRPKGPVRSGSGMRRTSSVSSSSDGGEDFNPKAESEKGNNMHVDKEPLQFSVTLRESKGNPSSSSDETTCDSADTILNKSNDTESSFEEVRTSPRVTPETSPRSSQSNTPSKRRPTSPMSIPVTKRRSSESDPSSGFCVLGLTGSYPNKNEQFDLSSIADDDNKSILYTRSVRINRVREIFNRAYFSAIGASTISYGAQQRGSLFGLLN